MQMDKEIFAALQEYIGERMADMHREDRFMEDYGLTSLELIEIACALEKKFGVSIPDGKLQQIVNAGDLLDNLNAIKQTRMIDYTE